MPSIPVYVITPDCDEESFVLRVAVTTAIVLTMLKIEKNSTKDDCECDDCMSEEDWTNDEQP